MDIIKILMMVLVGALSGTLAARVAGGTTYGFIVNALLGISGAVVGGFLFDLLNITPGSNIVKSIDNTFGVSLPPNIVGMVISAFVGALIIVFAVKTLKGGVARGGRRR